MAKPVVLIVRDGWGVNPNSEHDKFNAVKLAKTPCCDDLVSKYPVALIHTSSGDVGLPDKTMGNSEVGHQNLGAGRIVDQESVRITKAIDNGEFFENKTFVRAVDQAKNSGHTVHIMGIASDAGVHGRLDHLWACLELCKKRGAKKVAVHLFTDGRDTGPYTGLDYVKQVKAKCQQLGAGQIATIAGRYYAMDRDNRWQRIQLAFDALTGRNNPAVADSATSAVQNYYDNPANDSQQGDEFITPTAIGSHWQQTRLSDGDAVIFYNYRGDRPREIIKAFQLDDDQWAKVPQSPDDGQNGFDRGNKLDLHFVTMTAYEQGLPVEVAFSKPPKMENIGGQVLSDQGLTQFRCAETEKFAHVTFFFNDYREQPWAGEGRQMAQSPKVATYDLQPQMSAEKVRDIVLGRINASDGEDFILVNFANGDMVGHTGKLDAAIKAVETVDKCVGAVVEAVLAKGGKLIVTADHGNAEQMFNPETGSPHTSHTLYDVQCIVVDSSLNKNTKLRSGGRLADVFPTVLELMALGKPPQMTGRSLLELN